MELSLHRWGGFSILKLTQDYMGVCVEDEMVDYINGLDLADKNVVDGGSNIGIVSLFLSEKIGSGLVYSFELQRLIYQVGCVNFISNGRTNIVAFNNALSDTSGQWVGFTEIDYGAKNISSVGVKSEWKNGSINYYDRSKTIILDELEIPNIGLIKLDIEGGEPRALNGMWKSIDKWKPSILIELSPNYLENKEQETIDKIISHGYSVNKMSHCNYYCDPI